MGLAEETPSNSAPRASNYRFFAFLVEFRCDLEHLLWCIVGREGRRRTSEIMDFTAIRGAVQHDHLARRVPRKRGLAPTPNRSDFVVVTRAESVQPPVNPFSRVFPSFRNPVEIDVRRRQYLGDVGASELLQRQRVGVSVDRAADQQLAAHLAPGWLR